MITGNSSTLRTDVGAANWVVNNTHSAPILRITFRRSSSSAQLQCHKQVHSRVCFDRAQLLAICKPPISSTTNRTATEVRRSTDGWRIFSIKSRLSAPSPPGAQLATHLPNRSTSVVSPAAELSVRGALSSIDLEISGDLGEFRVKFRNVSYRFECAAVPPMMT